MNSFKFRVKRYDDCFKNRRTAEIVDVPKTNVSEQCQAQGKRILNKIYIRKNVTYVFIYLLVQHNYIPIFTTTILYV